MAEGTPVSPFRHIASKTLHIYPTIRYMLKRMLVYRGVSAIVLPALVLVRDTIADKTMTNLVDNFAKVPTSVVSHTFCSSCLEANIKAARSSHAEVHRCLEKHQNITTVNDVISFTHPPPQKKERKKERKSLYDYRGRLEFTKAGLLFIQSIPILTTKTEAQSKRLQVHTYASLANPQNKPLPTSFTICSAVRWNIALCSVISLVVFLFEKLWKSEN